MANQSGGAGGFVVVGLAALAAWWLYEQYFAPAAAVAAGTTSAGGTAAPPPANGTVSSAPPLAATPQTAPAYLGPDLDTMYSGLQSAVVAAYGADPALTCPGGVGAVSQGSQILRALGPVTIALPPTQGGHPAAVAGGVAPRSISPAPQAAPASCAPASISGTYDVFNYYLIKAVPSVGAAPNPPDHTSVVTLAQYWQWAAPALQAVTPGLSGIGPRGLGAVWGLGRLLS